jgi:hypothetical protein
MELAETSFALAEVLWSEGELSRARALAEAAEGAYAQAPAAAQERRAVTSWLAQHGASVVARRVTKRIRAR